MKVTKLIAGSLLAGAFGSAALGLSAGLATGDPWGPPPPPPGPGPWGPPGPGW